MQFFAALRYLGLGFFLPSLFEHSGCPTKALVFEGWRAFRFNWSVRSLPRQAPQGNTVHEPKPLNPYIPCTRNRTSPSNPQCSKHDATSRHPPKTQTKSETPKTLNPNLGTLKPKSPKLPNALHLLQEPCKPLNIRALIIGIGFWGP